ncbi:hypothetical protein ACFOZ7_06970 [Natribaculum luteum]|uniref:DUF7310 domain-containing protein n=1 Tax=Natribaculum luteum TaxID=1586232 RepID=A0ABD5NXC3_9EURY|nr:hypothetical protein [Natribaculum luteum]
MTDSDALERRLAAVERALVDGDHALTDLPDAAAVADELARLDERLDDLDARVAELEGSTRALRGYVGNVRSADEDVERRADAAIATVDRLERRVAALECATRSSDGPGGDLVSPSCTRAADGSFEGAETLETLEDVDPTRIGTTPDEDAGESVEEGENEGGVLASVRRLLP